MAKDLKEVAFGIRQLTVGHSTGATALRDLATKLETGGGVAMARVDLAATYAPETMLPGDSPSWRRLVSGLDLARDVLIFMPVIFTWWQLAQALSAYGKYTGNAPFLLAWQQGFGNRTEPLSSSAVAVASVVLGVVVLTVIAHFFGNRSEQRVRQRQQRLAVLLGEATAFIGNSLITTETDVSRVDLAEIAAQIGVSATLLKQALEKSSNEITSSVSTGPGSKLHEMFEAWTAAAGELASLGTQLRNTQETVEALRGTQAALAAMTTQIGEQTTQFLTALETERTQSRQEAHSHHELAAQVGESTRLLGDALKGLNERAEQFNELVLRMAFVVDRMEANRFDVSGLE